MCFSATASFTAAAVLLPAGLYSVHRALNVNRRFLMFACVPIFFAVQQFMEGLVWHYHAVGDQKMVNASSLCYLFFAYALWPFFTTLSIYAVEDNRARKKILAYFVWAGGLLGLLIYVPIVIGFEPMNVAVNGNSMVYDTYQSVGLIRLYCISYVLILIVPMFLSTTRGMRFFGILILASLIASVLWYFYAFTSVWCFFAAVLSVYVASLMRGIKAE